MRVVVAAPQVPFVTGGAELMASDLVGALRERGHEADLVTVPFKWYPGTRVLDQAFLWRLLDLTEADGRPIDRVIATKFPAYCVRHPNKIAWVLHQFRQAYDYDGTELGQFTGAPEDRAVRRAIERLDRVALGEARRVFATSRNVASRLQRYNGIEAEVLPHPPQALPYRTGESAGFVLSVNRLDRAKRIDLLIEAARSEPSLRVVIVGDGPDRERLEQLAAGLDGRVEFMGRVEEDLLADLYASSLAVYYAPVDEDFGMVPYEAFLSSKPVLTTTDAGGPLEIVTDRETGFVVPPDSAAIAPRVRLPRNAHRRGGGVGTCRACDCRARHVGCLYRRTPLVKVAYYSPTPPTRGRGSPTTRPCCSRSSPSASRSSSRNPAGVRLRPTSRSTTSGTTLTRTGGSSTPCASGPVSSCCTSTCCTIWSRASRSAAATGAATSTRWSASSASPDGCSHSACSTIFCRSCGRRSRSASRSRVSCSTARED